MSLNPLSNYFRQAALHIELPSNGEHYPEGALEKTQDGKYPVLPMTSQDEILYKTASTLLNNTVIVNLIESCIPNIKNAKEMPVIDVDKALIAIKIASFGTTATISAICPECEHKQTESIDLNKLISSIASPDYSKPIEFKDLKIYLHPPSYDTMTDGLDISNIDTEILAIVNNDKEPDSAKVEALSKFLGRLTDTTKKAITGNIARVVTPKSVVINKEHISEWLSNCDKQSFDFIRDAVVEFKAVSEAPPIAIKCTECGTEYKHNIVLDNT